MSVLHSRIIRHGGQGRAREAAGSNHPYGTGATPMIMPALHIHLEEGTGYYQTLYPSQTATADTNHVPVATMTSGGFGQVIPAGQP